MIINHIMPVNGFFKNFLWNECLFGLRLEIKKKSLSSAPVLIKIYPSVLSFKVLKNLPLI